MEITLRLTSPPIDLKTQTGKRAGTHPMADWAQVDAFAAYRGIPGEYLDLGRKTINEHGFISTPPIAAEKTPGTLRVAFLGGSSTACTSPNLPDDQTWPWVAAEELRRQWPDRPIEFINAGLPGYTTFESYARLWSRLRFFEPDIVVVYHAWNDMGYYLTPHRQYERHVIDRKKSWSFERPFIQRRIKRYGIDNWLEWSHLYCRVRRWFGEPLRGEVGAARSGKALAQSYGPQGPAILRDNLELFVAAQEPLEFELYVVKQGTLITATLPKSARAKCMVHFHGMDYDAHVRAYDEAYRIIDEVVPARQILDARSLSGQLKHFADHVHLRPAGAKALGELLARQIVAARAPDEASAEDDPAK